MKVFARIALFMLLLVAMQAWAGTLTVTSPNQGDFLGRNNSIAFNIRDGVVQVTVRATVTRDANPSERIVLEQKFTPDVDGKVSGSLALNFNQSTPEGNYTIRVEATEPGNSYQPVTRNVVVDVKIPEFLEFNPINGGFVKGVVPIRVRLDEPNIKEWRVQINNQDIPNNSGTSGNFTVLWDTSNVQRDGPQTISIKVDDRANNSTTKTINVTLDRVNPSINVLLPSGGAPIRPGTNVPVALEIVDQFTGSAVETGVTAVLRTMDGQFIGSVARRSSRANGSVLTWTGRIRWQNNLPGRFKLVVNATDRAGNRAVVQEVTITISGR